MCMVEVTFTYDTIIFLISKDIIIKLKSSRYINDITDTFLQISDIKSAENRNIERYLYFE